MLEQINLEVLVYFSRLSSSSLISGEGLTSMDVSSEAAKNEVTMIHQENVDRLLSLPEEEVLKEQQRVQQSLGEW